jgi:hypothetical protein
MAGKVWVVFVGQARIIDRFDEVLLYNMGHSAFALVLIPMYQMYA